MRKAFNRLVFETPEWVWLLLALLLRLAFSLKLGGRLHQIDEGSYDNAAWAWASSSMLHVNGQTLVTPPLPTTLFALCYRLGGHSLLVPRLAQALASTATAWALGRMTGRLSGSRPAGRLALACAAIYPFFIYYSGMLLSETLYLAMLVPSLWLLCESLQERGASWWKAPAAGLLLGLAALCRAEGAPIAALIWAAALVPCLMGRWPWRAWTCAVLIWLVPLLAWCARNQAAVGRFSLDNHGGLAMLHGTMFFELNEVDTAVAMAAIEKSPFYQESLSLTPAQRDQVYLRQSLRFMCENPAQVLRQWSVKVVNFWRFYPRTDKDFIETPTSRPGAGLSRPMLVALSLAFEPLLILGGLWGLWKLRQRWAELFPLMVFVLGTMGVHVVSVSQMRYRLPVMPVLMFAACIGAAGFLERRRPDQSAQR